MESDQMESRVRLFLSACMISCVSVRRKDSQGCTADVKDTPPSPKEKPDDLIGPDIDPVGDHDDLMAKGSRLSIESFDSGVSFKSDWSKGEPIDFKEGVSPSRLDLSSFEKKHDVADDGFFESPDDLMAMGRTLSEPAKSGFHIPLRQHSPLMRAHRSVEAFGSGLSLMNDSFIRPRQHSLPSVFITRMATGIPQSEPVKIDIRLPGSRQSPFSVSTRSVVSVDSGVSLKSDRSKDRLIYFID
ncbi:uncharacterized protein LOC125901202 isoform X6 [Epinephelus fuscoguttatus]|uniref:uncharacterized protein LOC125901202 isoform X6 n=1 Tax=Epinephelus fuscoguttatus TaxID=293821 RepID=UPI0020D1BB98|nr:uncharacterized protein LOC125901202 isoform X6 [Epinephelus fuscoguttatus]